MKIADCLPLMTQMCLARAVDGILKDEVPRGDEDRLRVQILLNQQGTSTKSRSTTPPSFFGPGTQA